MNKIFRVILFGILFGVISNSFACTEIVFNQGNNFFVGHNFDWSNGQGFIVINPQDVKRQAIGVANNEQPLQWVAKYGSITFDLTSGNNRLNIDAVTSGMNQAGLVASALWLDESQYPQPNSKEPTLNNTLWVQYVLDNFATVEQAVSALKKINIVAVNYAGKQVKIHLVIHDAAGNNAILEYLAGKLVIIQGKQLQDGILTNTVWSRANKSLSQYKPFGGNLNLPSGTNSEPRYVKARYLLKILPKLNQQQQAVNYGFSILDNLIEPVSSGTPTQWSIVYATVSRQIFLKTLTNPQIKIIAMTKINFKNSMRTLDINSLAFGNINSFFKPTSNYCYKEVICK